MALMRGKGPKDAVARMNPKFIRQKGQRLASTIGALRANAYLPLSLDQLRCDQYRQRQRPTEYRRKSDGVEGSHLSLPKVVSSPMMQAEKVKARPRQPLAARYFLARAAGWRRVKKIGRLSGLRQTVKHGTAAVSWTYRRMLCFAVLGPAGYNRAAGPRQPRTNQEKRWVNHSPASPHP